MGRVLIVIAAALVTALPRTADGRVSRAGGELSDLEDRVARDPDDLALSRTLAEAYARKGLVEEAVAQYLDLLAREPDDAETRARIEELTAARMPMWLPTGAEGLSPFPHTVLDLALADPGQAGKTIKRRLLVTQGRFASREGHRRDRTHKWLFPRIDYGYVWAAKTANWVMKARVHWDRQQDVELAQSALKTVLALYCVGRDYLGRDPTRPWGQPIDIWVAQEGKPGARAVGRDLYLYSVKTPRVPAEWVREVAHEYGHIALPGIGGFTKTDDPWADGHLGELLFPKWLAESGVPEWMPWSVKDAEEDARAQRERLVGEVRAEAMDQELVHARDERARDYLLGLALRVEGTAGPRFLGEVLARCRKGGTTQFLAAAEKLAKERGLPMWEMLNPTPAGKGDGRNH